MAEPVQQRLDRIGRVILVPLLGVSTLLAWLAERSGYGTPDRLRLGLVVAVAAAVWSVTVTVRSLRPGAGWRVVAFVGHVAIAAVLVGANPWFGVFAFTSYMLADELPGRGRFAGFVVSALIMAGSEVGGYPFISSSASWVAYLVVAVVNTVLVTTIVQATNRVLVQNAERGQMINDLNAANEQLSVALAENAGLHAQLVEQAREAGVQDERQRLAGEIHDTLAQGLTGIVTQLEAADQARHLPAEWQRHLDQARSLARSSLREARRSVRALRPEQLEHATLTRALDELAQSWTQTSGVAVRLEATGSEHSLPADIEAALFRVAQEGLTNVAKHAHAAKVWLTLTFLDDVVLLDVRDDGLGWTLAEPGGGYGLDGMRQRLARVGGTLEIETAPGEGTALSASIPVGSPA